MNTYRLRTFGLQACLLVLMALLSLGCKKSILETDDGNRSRARQALTRSDLIGGPGALGEVGDFILENDQVRFVIHGLQNDGYSRGNGVYGGCLLDADIVRPQAPDNPTELGGKDSFGELFPVFFLQALVPENIEILNDGSDGNAARIKVTGGIGDYLSMTTAINQVLMNSHELPQDLLAVLNPEELNGAQQLAYSVTYELAPGDSYVSIVGTIENIADEELLIPSPIASSLLQLLLPGSGELKVPVGHLALFGAGNDLFLPGVGYNVKLSLMDSYKTAFPFPAISGLITSGLFSSNEHGVSYGFFPARDGQAIDSRFKNFAKNRVDENGDNYYEKGYDIEVADDSILVPFLASSITGTFYAEAPSPLPAGEAYSFKTYFAVGDGDISSVMDIYYATRNQETGLFTGRVLDETTLAPVEEASIIVYEGNCDDKNEPTKPVNQLFTHSSGYFKGELPPGSYLVRIEKDPVLSELSCITIETGKTTYAELVRPGVARIAVQVRDSANQKLPAKVTVVGTYDHHEDLETREFLFDLEAGQRWRISDQVKDDPNDPSTRQYIETIGYTEDGHVSLDVRPNRKYTVYVSRGLEYDLGHFEVELAPGQGASELVVLERTVDTTGYIGSDFHIHADPSVDSHVSLHDRVVTAAANGLEFLTATDHNMITDYSPYIARADLLDWATSMVGLELTTLEAGHFNGYPLTREVGHITNGSFQWSMLPPDEIFEKLRARGELGSENTIIQVNHPRDSILGYFSQFDIDELSAEHVSETGGIAGMMAPNGTAFFHPETGETTFSLDFDAIEIMNGGVLGQEFHQRMPESIEGLSIPEDVLEDLPEAGTILCADDKVAFPGVIDDWFNLLNQGHTFAGIGNSDSHHKNDIGFPRSYVRVDDDRPRHVTPMNIVDGIRDHGITISNGPFIEASINGQPIGSKVIAADGEVELSIKIQTANWVGLSKITVFANGEILDVIPAPLAKEERVFETTQTYELSRDTWFVVVAEGENSLFPVIPPIDIPPFYLSDAFSTLAGAIGFGGTSALGELRPGMTGFYTPFGLTNPIWVDISPTTDADTGSETFTFDAPGIIPRECDGLGVVRVDDTGTVSSGLRTAPAKARWNKILSNSFGYPRVRGDIYDIRTLFDQYTRHSH